MGIFDFLSKKNKRLNKPAQPQAQPQEGHPGQKEAHSYQGDLNKTARLMELFQVPENNRDKNWLADFFDAVADASFKCVSPQIVQGPDSFPYVKLELPSAGEQFQCYVIRHMKEDFLIEQGFGVVILNDENQPHWVFSYGDILNYHLHGAFNAVHNLFTPKRNDETLDGKTQLRQGEPSEEILPSYARNAIAGMLKQFYPNPSVTLLYHEADNNYELAFNCTPDKFQDMDSFRQVLQKIGWFLPRYYAYCAVDENEASLSPLEKV